MYFYPLGGGRAKYNNPDNTGGTFRKYLALCHKEGIGNLNEENIFVCKINGQVTRVETYN